MTKKHSQYLKVVSDKSIFVRFFFNRAYIYLSKNSIDIDNIGKTF